MTSPTERRAVKPRVHQTVRFVRTTLHFDPRRDTNKYRQSYHDEVSEDLQEKMQGLIDEGYVIAHALPTCYGTLTGTIRGLLLVLEANGAEGVTP